MVYFLQVYLSLLLGSIDPPGGREEDDPMGEVDRGVKNAAHEALNFLRNRETFWEQVEMGKTGSESGTTNTTSSSISKRKKRTVGKRPKALQSTRLNYMM